MNADVEELRSALREATPFGETILQRQCERLGHSPDDVPSDIVPQLMKNIRIVMRGYLEPQAFAIFEMRVRHFGDE